MKKTVLITGGAGYIGSHIVLYFVHSGYNIVILDHTECPIALAYLVNSGAVYYMQADYGNEKIVSSIFSTYTIDVVIHCAAFIEVAESVRNPLAYYDNNVAKTLVLLRAMRNYGVHSLIFSSSCAVYGNPDVVPIPEDHAHKPLSPYGKTKSIIEGLLEDCKNAYGLNYIILRYFNAAGAMPHYGLGEMHEPESHIIPLVLQALQEQKTFTVFGNKYNTSDGTCVRDYIHVWDIAAAHEKAVRYLELYGVSNSFNLGTGTGFSVLQIIKTLEKITQRSLTILWGDSRPGDAAVLLASTEKAKRILCWQPVHSDIHTIVDSAYQFLSVRATLVPLPKPNLLGGQLTQL